MANSSIIGKAKNTIIKELIKDDAIVQAIGAEEIDEPEKLVDTHIFNYHQNPNTINTVATFITVQVHIPQSYMSSAKYVSTRTYVNPTIQIYILSHEKHMVVDNVPKVTENRNDYLSRLIDNKFNGYKGLGFGELSLVYNTEGSYQKDYVFRDIVFEATDLNNSLCSTE